jgi:tetratricopeptide (TPR) repeat protein
MSYKCPGCGQSVELSWRFCPNCTYDLSEKPVKNETTVAQRSILAKDRAIVIEGKNVKNVNIEDSQEKFSGSTMDLLRDLADGKTAQSRGDVNNGQSERVLVRSTYAEGDAIVVKAEEDVENVQVTRKVETASEDELVRLLKVMIVQKKVNFSKPLETGEPITPHDEPLLMQWYEWIRNVPSSQITKKISVKESYFIGKSLIEATRFQEGAHVLGKTREVFKLTNMQAFGAACTYWEATSLMQMGQNSEAVNLLSSIISEMPRGLDDNILAMVTMVLANAQLKINPGEAERNFSLAWEIFKKEGVVDKEILCLLGMARIASIQQNVQRANELFLKCVKKAGATNINSLKATVMNSYGMFLMQTGDLLTAEQKLLESVILAEKDSDKLGVIIAKENLAQVKRLMKNYGESVRLYDDVIAMRRLMGDQYSLSTTINNRGMAYYEWGRACEAVSSFTEAISLFESLNTPIPDLAMSLYNLGCTQCDMQDFRNAKRSIEKALNMFRQLNMPEAMYAEDTLRQINEVERGL